jgi:hypothetical protein
MTVDARSNREMVFVSRTDTRPDASRLVGEHESGALDPDAGAVR